MTRLQKMLAMALVVVGLFIIWQQMTMERLRISSLIIVSIFVPDMATWKSGSVEAFENTVPVQLDYEIHPNAAHKVVVVDELSRKDELDWVGIGVVRGPQPIEPFMSLGGIVDAEQVVSLTTLSHPTYDDFVEAMDLSDRYIPGMDYSVFRTRIWRNGAILVGFFLACTLAILNAFRSADAERERLHKQELARMAALQSRAQDWQARRERKLASRAQLRDTGKPIAEAVHHSTPPSLDELEVLIRRYEGESCALISRRPYLAAELAWERDSLVRDLKALQLDAKPRINRIARLHERVLAFERHLSRLQHLVA